MMRKPFEPRDPSGNVGRLALVAAAVLVGAAIASVAIQLWGFLSFVWISALLAVLVVTMVVVALCSDRRSERRQQIRWEDALHELRSPITALRVGLDIAAKHPDALSVGSLRPELDRLEGLLNDLRSTIAGEPPSRNKLVALQDVVTVEVQRTRRVPVAVRFAGDGAALVASEDVERALRHLLDNAARHARTRVALAVEITSSEVTLTVDDDGEGVPRWQRRKVFRRGYRSASSVQADGGGHGLGLPVAAGLARRHGGRISLTDAPIGGARFQLRVRRP